MEVDRMFHFQERIHSADLEFPDSGQGDVHVVISKAMTYTVYCVQLYKSRCYPGEEHKMFDDVRAYHMVQKLDMDTVCANSNRLHDEIADQKENLYAKYNVKPGRYAGEPGHAVYEFKVPVQFMGTLDIIRIQIIYCQNPLP